MPTKREQGRPDTRAIVRAIVRGERPMTDLESCFDDRAAALDCYAREAASLFPPREIAGPCELCGVSEATSQTALCWMALKSFNWKKDVAKGILLFPLVLAFQCAPFALDYLLPEVGTSARWASFTTVHNLCGRCHTRLRVRGALAALARFLFGLVLLVCFGATLILGAFCVASALSLVGWSPGDLRLFAPLFVAAAALLWASSLCLRRIPARIHPPRALARVARKPFAPA